MRAHNKLQLATQLVGEAALVITAALGIKAAYTTQSDKKIAMAEQIDKGKTKAASYGSGFCFPI